jgi:hypothetical protein
MKSLTELKNQLDEVRGGGINVVYSSDFKLDPNGRIIHPRRIKIGDKADSSVGIRAPGVGEEEDNDSTLNSVEKTEKLYNKLYKSIKAQNKKPNPNNPIAATFTQEEIELSEGKSEDPPYVLVLKRQNIRMFPDNIKVALYYNDKIKKYFSVAYGKDVNALMQSEEVEIKEEQNIVSDMLKTFLNLSEENRIKMLEMVEKDSESYLKVKKFIKEQV